MRNRLLAYLVCLAWIAPSHAGAYDPCDNSRSAQSRSSNAFFTRLTPGISWPAWWDLLGRTWGPQQQRDGQAFNAQQILDAAASYPKIENLPTSYSQDFEAYTAPRGDGDGAQREAYEKADAIYRSGRWGDAIPLFDRIATDRGSAYCAAAMYMAARSAIKVGDLKAGIERISRIVSDPSTQEFHPAAYRLLGTMAYKTGAEAIFAARLVNIAHILTAPPVRVCSDHEMHRLHDEAAMDLEWYLSAAFADDVFSVLESTQPARRALRKLAETDEIIALWNTLAAPTPFTADSNWEPFDEHTEHFRKFDIAVENQRVRHNATSDAEQLTAHALDRWRTTHNHLWGYAFAQRTSDPAQFANIAEMLVQLSTLPATPAVDAARPAFHWHYVRHGARLLLMGGKIDQALEFVRLNGAGDRLGTSLVYGGGGYYRGEAEPVAALLNGGTRLFLQRFQFDLARQWSKEAGTLLGVELDSRLKTLVADGFGDLLRSSPKWDVYGIEYPEPTLAATDVLSAGAMATLSRTAGISRGFRRATAGAAWVRAYALGRSDLTQELLPDLRDAFPELAPDIDLIIDANSPKAKKYLAARMLLRAPGLSIRPPWSRDSQYAPHSIFEVAEYDIGDLNWWCPLSIDKLKVDFVQNFFARPLNLTGYIDIYLGQALFGGQCLDDASVRGVDEFPFEGERAFIERNLALAERVIAWHPLLKAVDWPELQQLARIKSGPELLTTTALEWARESTTLSRQTGNDRLIPETLHMAVQSTRYGCRRSNAHGPYSRAAYVWLHSTEPDSEWTKKTPYWFDKPGWNWLPTANTSGPTLGEGSGELTPTP